MNDLTMMDLPNKCSHVLSIERNVSSEFNALTPLFRGSEERTTERNKKRKNLSAKNYNISCISNVLFK